MRSVLLIAHIAAAIVCLGPLTAATSLFPRAALTGNRGEMVAYHRISRVYGMLSVSIAAIGLALAGQSGYLSSGWVWTSLGAFGAGGALLGAVVVPRQRRLLGATTVERGDVGPLRAASGVLALLWVGVLALMVTKPF
jgi:hypothetical protein